MIVAVVPVKRLRDAKSRLAPSLMPDERAELAMRLAERTVEVIAATGQIARVAITTPEEWLARRLGAAWIPDAGSLNRSLQKGIAWAMAQRASLLIVPADLPEMEAADIQAVLAALGDDPGIVIAPTHDGGTGALLISPPDALSPSFGVGSYQRHIALARSAGIGVAEVRRGGLARDLDTMEDLAALMRE